MSEENIPLLVDMDIFRLVEQICKKSIEYSANHKAIRETISALCVHLSVRSEHEFGTLSVEARSLSQLLKRTQVDYCIRDEKPKFIDPIMELVYGTYPRLKEDHLQAVDTIRSIWESFGRLLTPSGHNYQKAGSKKSKKSSTPLQPMDLMGENIYNLWKDVYVPWFNQAKQKFIVNNNNEPYNEGAITLQVVVDLYPPKLVDESRRLMRGTTVKVLQRQLELFPTCKS